MIQFDDYERSKKKGRDEERERILKLIDKLRSIPGRTISFRYTCAIIKKEISKEPNSHKKKKR